MSLWLDAERMLSLIGEVRRVETTPFWAGYRHQPETVPVVTPSTAVRRSAATCPKAGTQVRAYLTHLLDEAPVPLVVRAVEEAAANECVAPKAVWRNVAKLADPF